MIQMWSEPLIVTISCSLSIGYSVLGSCLRLLAHPQNTPWSFE